MAATGHGRECYDLKNPCRLDCSVRHCLVARGLRLLPRSATICPTGVRKSPWFAGAGATHNPKVAGSNPAPATNRVVQLPGGRHRPPPSTIRLLSDFWRIRGVQVSRNTRFQQMALGGWKTERMMRRYAAVTDQTLRAAAEAVSGLRGRAIPNILGVGIFQAGAVAI